jgi:RNA:NAD 2'-phosphotransferase (TPT1/KptA family)
MRMMYCLLLDDENERYKTKEREIRAVPDYSIPIKIVKDNGHSFFYHGGEGETILINTCRECDEVRKFRQHNTTRRVVGIEE